MKRKGFTLIELLAVILILGIIALIAIPTVNNIIKESKRGAFKSSVDNIIEAAERNCQVEQIKGDNRTSVYSFNETGITPNLDVKGSMPTSGYIYVNDECIATTINITNGDYYVNGGNGSIVLSETKKTVSPYDETIVKGYAINGMFVDSGLLGGSLEDIDIPAIPENYDAILDAIMQINLLDFSITNDEDFAEYEEVSSRYTYFMYNLDKDDTVINATMAIMSKEIDLSRIQSFYAKYVEEGEKIINNFNEYNVDEEVTSYYASVLELLRNATIYIDYKNKISIISIALGSGEISGENFSEFFLGELDYTAEELKEAGVIHEIEYN